MKNKITLDESEIPKQWYNINADLKTPLDPPLHPATLKPIGPQDLAPLFPMALIEQEMSPQRWVDIPEEVLKIYRLYRPTPLYRAFSLERAIGTRSKIYYKYEGVSPSGSHKPNTAIAQAYYNKQAGVKRLATETGAGQWGSALSLASKLFGLECTVYMVKVSYQQKPYRRSMIETWGAKVHASPTNLTNAGRAMLKEDPDSLGSLGLAISEAVEDAATHDDTKYCLGSVLNHVLMHQTVVGLEAKKQMEIAGDYPDVVIACCGGGSNLGGIANPFIMDKLAGKKVRAIAAEPFSCPTLTKGVYAYDYGDLAKTGPVIMMYTLGHDFMPPGIHAGGLRYHGDSPIISKLVHEGIMEATALHQLECFEAATTFARSEGIIMAPESSYALRAAIIEAKKADESGKSITILFNLSGHGHFDMSAYDAYFAGNLKDYEYPKEKIEASLKKLPKV